VKCRPGARRAPDNPPIRGFSHTSWEVARLPKIRPPLCSRAELPPWRRDEPLAEAAAGWAALDNVFPMPGLLRPLATDAADWSSRAGRPNGPIQERPGRPGGAGRPRSSGPAPRSDRGAGRVRGPEHRHPTAGRIDPGRVPRGPGPSRAAWQVGARRAGAGTDRIAGPETVWGSAIHGASPRRERSPPCPAVTVILEVSSPAPAGSSAPGCRPVPGRRSY
jgi:hypothetical protein